MASSRTRQRKLARAKMERQLARRAAKLRRQRQVQAGLAIGLVAVVGIVVTMFATGVFSGKKTATASSTCIWNKQDTTSNTNLKDVGEPPTSGEPRTGTETMAITFSQGTVDVALNLSQAPCTAASFKYLAGKKFFDNTTCHRLLDKGDYVLQCGDPSGTGQGGPSYQFPDEYVPSSPVSPTPSTATTATPKATGTPAASATPAASGSAEASPSPSASAAPMVLYPAGSVAMANAGADTNGSQFFIVYKDSYFPASYTLFGTVTSGLDVVTQIAAAGEDGSNALGDGKPKKTVTITSLTVSSASSNASPTPAAGASATPSASSSASASAKS